MNKKMRNSKKASVVTSFSNLSKEDIELLIKGELPREVLERHLTDGTRKVSLSELEKKLSDKGYPYAYPSWFSNNVSLFKVVSTITGEVLKEIKYITRKLMEDSLGYDLQNHKVVLYVS